AAAVLQRLDEVVAGRRFPVVPLEVEVGAGTELVGTEHRRQHPDYFGAFVVDGRGVEVRNLDVAVGPNGVRERPGILRELRGAEHSDILDELDSRCASGR